MNHYIIVPSSVCSCTCDDRYGIHPIIETVQYTEGVYQQMYQDEWHN